MTRREQNMLVLLLGVGFVLGAAGLLYGFFLAPSAALDADIAVLNKEIFDKERTLKQLEAEKKQLERFRLMSLPGKVDNPAEAQSEYRKYLSALLKECEFTDVSVTPQKLDRKKAAAGPGKKASPHKVVGFDVEVKADLAQLVLFLDKMEKAPLVHRVKALHIGSEGGSASSGAKEGRLAVKMTIEGLIVNGTKRAAHLLGPDTRLLALDAFAALRRGPAGLAMIPVAAGPGGKLDLKGKTPSGRSFQDIFTGQGRRYADISQRNIFIGKKPPEPVVKEKVEPKGPDTRKYWRLALIHTIQESGKSNKVEAFLRNLLEEPSSPSAWKRLRAGERSGFDRFWIYDNRNKVILKGKVLRIDHRAVYFQVDEEIYALHSGQSLLEAMEKSDGTGNELTRKHIDKLSLGPRKTGKSTAKGTR